jgi:predicted dehydrogenase/threonine dehydrogenase-like Zn-dependent dehydrogenase
VAINKKTMRQIISDLRTGETRLEDVPAPSVEPGHLLIQTRRTIVSQGTEKMLVQFGKASLFQKLRSQPTKARQVLGKIRTDGFVPTLEAVFRKLDRPLALGYCNSGVVIGVGNGVVNYQIGDRVASNGPHAEVVSVPHNLVAKIPPNVSDESAAFTVVGAIGLQGIRLAKPELGETFVVIGLGLIGQITGQLLRANGCRVIGFDFDLAKVELARRYGIEARISGGEEDPVKTVNRLTKGLGCDAVIITASTQSNQVIAQAAQMTRKRGRIILVGVIGLNINREDFYEKELTFQVSCSYGPGRYDDCYEDKGMDYPVAFVRWTENRNFGAVLDAMATGVLRVEPLISRRVPLAQFGEIYNDMDAGGLASMLIFGDEVLAASSSENPSSAKIDISIPSLTSSTIKVSHCSLRKSSGALAIIGAGNFTAMTAMPALARANAPVKVIVSANGMTGTALARKYGILYSCTNYEAVLADKEIEGVVIATRHHLHSMQVVAALNAGKRVLVEKPLCLTAVELKEIEIAVEEARGKAWVSVGFNRRFSPHAEQMRRLLSTSCAPATIIATMNAGSVSMNHWVHDPLVGGGRLLGEACHFIDLAIFLTGSLVAAVSASEIGGASDCASILLRHVNGSTSVVNYLANGCRDLSKERVEAHNNGRSLLLDNFRELRGFGFRSFASLKTKQDKGHGRQFSLFAERVRTGGESLIPWVEITNSARATLAVPLAIAERRWVSVNEI